MASILFTFTGDSSSAVGAAKAVDASLAGVDVAASKVSADLNAVGVTTSVASSRIEAAGDHARRGLRGATEAAQAFGIDISGTIGPMQGAASAAEHLSAGFEGLGVSAGIIGLLVAGLALVAAKTQELFRAQVDGLKGSDAYLQSFRDIAATAPAAAAAVDQLAQAELRLKEAQNLPGRFDVTANAQASVDAQTQALESSYGAATLASNGLEHLRETTLSTAAGYGVLKGSIDDTTTGLNAQEVAATAAGNALAFALRAGNINAAASMADAIQTTDNWTVRLGVNTEANNRINKRGADVTNEFDAANKKLAAEGLALATAAAQKLAAANEALIGKVKSLVEAALVPTTVADRLKSEGDVWDEFRLRLDAINTGTPLDAYGPDYVKQVTAMQKATNLSLPDMASKFKDFSLFANMDWLKAAMDTGAVDLGPIRDKIQIQINQIIGFANLAKVAFDDIWSGMSTGQKIDLAKAMGLDASGANIEALKTGIQNAVTGAMTGIQLPASATTGGTDALAKGLAASATSSSALNTQLGNITTALPLLQAGIEKNAVPSLDALDKQLTGSTNAAVTILATQLTTAMNSATGLHDPLTTMQTDLDLVSAKITAVGPAFDTFNTDIMSPLRDTLEAIDVALALMLQLLEDTAAAAKNWTPPVDLKSGSPSPLERTLGASVGYMQDLAHLWSGVPNGSMPGFNGFGHSARDGGSYQNWTNPRTAGDAGTALYNHGTIIVQSNDPDDMLEKLERKLGASVNVRIRQRERA